MEDLSMKKYVELINKSVGAALLIALGNYALLKLGNPIGPVIFALGLLGVCYMGLNLFTGKCGFLFQDKIKPIDLSIILVVNLIAGYLIGLVLSTLDEEVFKNAVNKVGTWEMSIPFFVKSVLCGIIMYIAVYMYKKQTPLGIIYGIPLFIFCGFQHCIANIITMGVARTFSSSIFVCIIGNFIGSLFIWFISKEISSTDNKIKIKKKN
jgi:formate/nitrite transporter FocA (FNT family)